MPAEINLSSLIADVMRPMNNHQRSIFEKLLICSLPPLIKNAADLAIATAPKKPIGTKRPRGRPRKIQNE